MAHNAVLTFLFLNFALTLSSQKSIAALQKDPLAPNHILDSIEKLYQGKIGKGPESIAIRNGKLYTGVEDGRIFEIGGKKIKTIVRVGNDHCDTEKTCGRPLGMKFDSKGELIVADSEKGIYRVDVNAGTIVSLVSTRTMVDGKPINFPNDVAIAKNGDIYFSDTFSSPKNKPYWKMVYDKAHNGRLLHYDPETRAVRTLLDNLISPNGVELSPDEEFLIICQTFDQSIVKYYLKGPKKGTNEIFVNNLPGFPDNVRSSGRGTYWVALPVAIQTDKPSLWEKFTWQPGKYLLYNAMQLLVNLTDLARRISPKPIWNAIHDTVEGLIMYTIYKPLYGLVIEVNSNGEIIRSLRSPKGIVHSISQVTEYKGSIYFGSFLNSYIGKLKLR